MKFSFPNSLTYFRIGVVPFIVICLIDSSHPLLGVAAFLFLLASLSDLLDGILARRLNMVSELGKMLDPLADKILMMSVLVMLVSLNKVPGWIAVLFLIREFMLTGLRSESFRKRKEGIASSHLGKWKMFFQTIGVFFILLNGSVFAFNLSWIGLTFLIFALILGYCSMIYYFTQYFKAYVLLK